MTGPILEFLDEWGTENLDMVDIREIANPKTTKVFVNGNWVGVHRDPEDLISEFTDLMQYPSFCISCVERFSPRRSPCSRPISSFPLTLSSSSPFFPSLLQPTCPRSLSSLPPSSIPPSSFFSHSCRSIEGAEKKS